jgi:hypothetical protein
MPSTPQYQRSVTSTNFESTNYYHLLGVEPEATQEEIRLAFYDICKRFHPDKKKGDFGADQLEHWSAMQTAWKCLSNETRRIIYDIRIEGREVSVEDCARLLKLQKAQATRDIENMKIEHGKVVERERRKHGIVIVKALYGDLRREAGSENIDFNGEHLVGPFVDVAIPLQCAVDSHKLILPGGVAKADLPGFYNPIPLIEAAERPCALYLQYDFKGFRHEVTVSENDALWIPLKGHAIAPGAKIQGPNVNFAKPVDEDQEGEATNYAKTVQSVKHDKDSNGGDYVIIAGVACVVASAAAFWYLKNGKRVLIA